MNVPQSKIDQESMSYQRPKKKGDRSKTDLDTNDEPCDLQSAYGSARTSHSVVQTGRFIMSEPPRACDTAADLVFDYDISEIIRKTAHGSHIPFFLCDRVR